VSEFIKRPAHVALAVPDLAASVGWATTVMGLREVERDGGSVYLTHSDCHHSLQLIEAKSSGLDHVSLEAHDGAALDALIMRLGEAGIEILSDTPQEHGIERAIRFKGPAGHVIEVFTGMSAGGPTVTGKGVQPRKFGHPMLTAEDSGPTVALFLDTLDFRLSDDVGEGILVFMRCHSEHHGVGVGKGPRSGLNHYAWEVADLGVLGNLGDVLSENGGRFIWGPGRHGAGENIFTYHFDPAGHIVEYYADIYHVWDEGGYEAGHWSIEDPRFANLWGPGPPMEMMETAIPIV
jgi:catechol 2,3-dioxygenase-like lactoylglutathione lyase family enzyme